jgi:hypothetical protein
MNPSLLHSSLTDPLPYSGSTTLALRGHTVEHARSFWKKFNLGIAVEEHVFLRGFLAILHRDNIESAFEGKCSDYPHTTKAFSLDLCESVIDDQGNHVLNPTYEYLFTEEQSLRKVWTTALPARDSGSIGLFFYKYEQLWWSLRQLSMPHALLLIMSVFGAITQ